MLGVEGRPSHLWMERFVALLMSFRVGMISKLEMCLVSSEMHQCLLMSWWKTPFIGTIQKCILLDLSWFSYLLGFSTSLMSKTTVCLIL